MAEWVNVVVLSDHGMTVGHHTNQDSQTINKVNLSQHLRNKTYRSAS